MVRKLWNHWETFRDRTNNPVEGINLGKLNFFLKNYSKLAVLGYIG